MGRTRVKICGLTSAEDALAAVEAGADALGFVFAESPRRVDADTVAEITRLLPPFVTTVGVFANAPLHELEEVMSKSGLMIAQLHGQESADYVGSVTRPVIKRVQITHDEDPLDLMERIRALGVDDVLFDPGAGSGVRGDLGLIPFRFCKCPRIYVAGGLNASNAAEVVLQVGPFAVDVCSGVEASSGVKDRLKMREFVQAVSAADMQVVRQGAIRSVLSKPAQPPA